MSSDALTIIIGVVGVLASVLCAIVAFRRGAKKADRQNAELILKIKEVRSIFSAFARSVADRPALAGVESTSVKPEHTEPGMTSATKTTIELLVRASLGTLVNERGQVQLSRLFQEVAVSLGAPHYSDTSAILLRLREDGIIDWDGPPDLESVSTIHLRAPGEHRRILLAPDVEEGP